MSLISSPPPPRRMTMHMHPPSAFNIQYSNIYDLNLRLKPYTILTMQRHPPRLFVGFLTSQQHASVSQGRICTDNFTCCHTEIEVADLTFYLTQSPSLTTKVDDHPENQPSVNDLTLYDRSTRSLISSSPPSRHMTMQMHPPCAFNTPIFTISNLRLKL